MLTGSKINPNFFKKIPVIVCTLVLLFIVVAIVVIVLHQIFLNKAFLFYLSYYCNTYLLLIPFFLIFIYALIKISLYIHKSFLLKKATKKEIKDLFKEIFYFFLIYIGVIFSGAILNKLPHAVTPERIIWTSNLLLNCDHYVFGKDLLFFINNLVNSTGGGILSWTLLQFYNSFPFVVITLALILFLHNKVLAKKFVLFSFIFVFLSFPLWYLLPGLNPINFYINNLLKVDSQNRISLELKYYKPDSVLSSYQKNFSSSLNAQNFLDVTTFPSAHSGFSAGVIIYSFLFYPPSAFITVPWFILEMTGALYLGQHYAIDLFLGLIMAVLVYYLVELIFHYKTIFSHRKKQSNQPKNNSLN
jgi:membrane-associated phospholipid phosphatase